MVDGRYKHLVVFFSNLVVLILEGLSYAYIWYEIYSKQIDIQYFRRGNWAVIGIYVIVIYFVTSTLGGYKISYLRFFDIALSHVLSIIIGAFIAYVEVALVTRMYLSPLPVAFMSFFQCAVVFLWVWLTRKVYLLLYPPRKMILIYGNYSPDLMLEKISGRKDKYDVCGVISCFEDDNQIRSRLSEYEGVIFYDIPSERRNNLLKYCYRHSIRTYVTPNITDVILNASEEIHLFDTPLLLSRNNGLNITQLFAKRLFDIVVSAVFLLVLSPFMLIAALAIKLYDGGPVFFSQKRLTRDMREFSMIKFRSMVQDAESDEARLAGVDDTRITPIGKLLRRTHFDETPQLLNIIIGDMSLVGPRPERLEIHVQYRDSIPEFDYRLKVKAGLTGYAQVYGKYNTTPYDKLKMDLTYIQGYSFLMDIKLLLLTVKVIFMKENTEGIGENQTTALHVDKV